MFVCEAINFWFKLHMELTERDRVLNCGKLVVLMANEGEYCYDIALKVHKGLNLQDII